MPDVYRRDIDPFFYRAIANILTYGSQPGLMAGEQRGVLSPDDKIVLVGSYPAVGKARKDNYGGDDSSGNSPLAP